MLLRMLTCTCVGVFENDILCVAKSVNLCAIQCFPFIIYASLKSVMKWVMLSSVSQLFWNNSVAGHCTLTLDQSSPACHFLVTKRERERLLMVQCGFVVTTLRRRIQSLP